jgi:hypothetical protein
MNNGWQFPAGWEPRVSNTKEIEFLCGDKSVLKNFPIVPAKDCLPDWYSDLKANNDNGVPTIAGCWTVRDIVTAGYIIPNVFEQEIIAQQNYDTGEEELERVFPVERIGQFMELQNKFTAPSAFHSNQQCPVHIQGKKKSYIKVSVPWKIKTPPGYSCLFVQPFWHFDQEFVLMPAIIDTDEFDLNNLNFPCYLTDPVKLIKPGEPLVQVIPFKRDNWKHTLKYEVPTQRSKMNLFLHNMYKRAFHQKKSFQ